MKRKDGIFQRVKDGPYYAIVQWGVEHYTDPTGKQKVRPKRYCESTKTTNRTEAKDHLADMKAQLRNGTYRTPTQRREEKKAKAEQVKLETVGALADHWLGIYVAAHRNEKGRKLARVTIDRYLKPFMGGLPVERVVESTLLQYRVYLEAIQSETGERYLSDTSVRHLLADAKCIFAWSQLPIPKKLLPKPAEQEPRGLSPEEQRAVCALDGPLGFASRIMLGTGARWSELCRLTSAHVNGGEVVIEGETKNRKRRRVPVAAELYAEMKGHVGKLVPFQSADNSAFCRMVQRASGVTDFSAHRLRHSYALNCLREGGNLEALRKNLGHGSLAVTEMYLRAGQDLQREDAKHRVGWQATA